MIAEGDVEELEICSGRAQDYEPLAYVAYLFAGIIAGITDVTIARARASSSAERGHHARDRHRGRARARTGGVGDDSVS